jgi:hypothetical protein
VFASLDEVPASALRMLARGLSLAERPLSEFAQSVDHYADCVEYEDIEGWLAELRLAHSAGVASRHPNCPDLLERLEGLEEPPWAQLREALLAARRACSGALRRFLKPMARPEQIDLGQRHAALWAMGAEQLGVEWLREQGTPIFGMSDRGRAVARIGCVTISEDGEGGFEWRVEEHDKVTYGRIDKAGHRHTETKPRPDS